MCILLLKGYLILGKAILNNPEISESHFLLKCQGERAAGILGTADCTEWAWGSWGGGGPFSQGRVGWFLSPSSGGFCEVGTFPWKGQGQLQRCQLRGPAWLCSGRDPAGRDLYQETDFTSLKGNKKVALGALWGIMIQHAAYHVFNIRHPLLSSILIVQWIFPQSIIS